MVAQARNHTVDILKGFLILMVVLGHVLLGTLQDNVLRYFIYSFHMPAFFFISGYLTNVEKLSNLSFKAMLSKYWHRMLKAWLCAFVIYSAYALRDCLGWKSVLKLCVQPYYHLWFVPALFLMICVAHQLFRHSRNTNLNYFLLFGVGVLLYNFSLTKYSIDSYWNLHLLVFFALGLLSGQILMQINKQGRVIVAFSYLFLTLLPWFLLGERDVFLTII